MNFTRNSIVTLTLCATMVFSADIFAWGQDGHSAVGILSLGQLQSETRIALERVLGSVDEQTIIAACNWPDAVRETDEWAWSYPLHFINIPPDESSYNKSRDCPEQLCATEAIKKYAAELSDRQASTEKRRQAFAWVCHLTGDLHQPLHAGYAYDRGANDFAITFKGEQMNLHNFWDRALIKARAGGRQQLIEALSRFPMPQAGDNWSAGMVDSWTDESRQLVKEDIYPQDPEIRQSYANKSWEIMQQRMVTAASRLALIINTVL